MGKVIQHTSESRIEVCDGSHWSKPNSTSVNNFVHGSVLSRRFTGGKLPTSSWHTVSKTGFSSSFQISLIEIICSVLIVVWMRIFIWYVWRKIPDTTCLEYPTCPRQVLWRCCLPQRIGKGSDARLQTKIYNLETDEFVSNLPLSNIKPTFRWWIKKNENLEFLK